MLAVDNVTDEGARPARPRVSRHETSRTAASSTRIPTAGNRSTRATGRRSASRPGSRRSTSRRGREARDDAVAALDAERTSRPTCTRSSRQKPAGQVVAQDPKAGQGRRGRDRAHQRLEGAEQVSAERRRPAVRQRAADLQGAGFEVARARRRLERAGGHGRRPGPGGGDGARGARRSRSRSRRGRATTTVPDVTASDEGSAKATLDGRRLQGRRRRTQDTTDPTRTASSSTRIRPGGTKVQPRHDGDDHVVATRADDDPRRPRRPR